MKKKRLEVNEEEEKTLSLREQTFDFPMIQLGPHNLNKRALSRSESMHGGREPPAISPSVLQLLREPNIGKHFARP